jgi:L,D-transpeptidase ErfK/SrfK
MAILTRPLSLLALALLLAGCAGAPEAPPETAAARPPEAAEPAAPEAEVAVPSPAPEPAPEPAVNDDGAEDDAPALERRVTFYTVRDGEDMLDIARAQDLGFLEVRAANPGVEPWLPGVGRRIILPDQHIAALTMDRGLLINLSQMRLFRFEGGQVVETHPLGIGREGLETPVGRTSVVRKAKDPTWRPTERMRQEKPELPAVVPPGPDNPLGTRAMYLGWPLYRIHGTNIPWGVGRRVSSGCIRMYPEDVEPFYDNVDIGLPVEVVYQPLLAEWRDGRLWVEVHPSAEGWDALEDREPLPKTHLSTQMVRIVADAAPPGTEIDWTAIARAVQERRGYPVAVGHAAASAPAY